MQFKGIDIRLSVFKSSFNIYSLRKLRSGTLVFTTLPSFPSQSIPENMRRGAASEIPSWGDGGKVSEPERKPLDFTKEVNRWTQRREDGKRMSGGVFLCCHLSQASWTPPCIYLIRWIVATGAEYPSASSVRSECGIEYVYKSRGGKRHFADPPPVQMVSYGPCSGLSQEPLLVCV